MGTPLYRLVSPKFLKDLDDGKLDTTIYNINPYSGASILIFICAKANKIDIILCFSKADDWLIFNKYTFWSNSML